MDDRGREAEKTVSNKIITYSDLEHSRKGGDTLGGGTYSLKYRQPRMVQIANARPLAGIMSMEPGNLLTATDGKHYALDRYHELTPGMLITIEPYPIEGNDFYKRLWKVQNHKEKPNTAP